MSIDISLNSSLLIQIVNFVILIIALNVILYKPIRGILAKRKNVVDSLAKGAENVAAKAEKSGIKFSEDIKAARIEGTRRKNEIIETAADEEAALLSEIQQESMGKIKEIKGKISKDTETAKASLEKDISVFASQIAEKILGRAV